MFLWFGRIPNWSEVNVGLHIVMLQLSKFVTAVQNMLANLLITELIYFTMLLRFQWLIVSWQWQCSFLSILQAFVVLNTLFVYEWCSFIELIYFFNIYFFILYFPHLESIISLSSNCTAVDPFLQWQLELSMSLKIIFVWHR